MEDKMKKWQISLPQSRAIPNQPEASQAKKAEVGPGSNCKNRARHKLGMIKASSSIP
jgi:hypothetical protein